MIVARRAETVAHLLDLEPATGKVLCRAAQPSDLRFGLGNLRIDRLEPRERWLSSALVGVRRASAYRVAKSSLLSAAAMVVRASL